MKHRYRHKVCNRITRNSTNRIAARASVTSFSRSERHLLTFSRPLNITGDRNSKASSADATLNAIQNGVDVRSSDCAKNTNEAGRPDSTMIIVVAKAVTPPYASAICQLPGFLNSIERVG